MPSPWATSHWSLLLWDNYDEFNDGTVELILSKIPSQLRENLCLWTRFTKWTADRLFLPFHMSHHKFQDKEVQPFSTPTTPMPFLNCAHSWSCLQKKKKKHSPVAQQFQNWYWNINNDAMIQKFLKHSGVTVLEGCSALTVLVSHLLLWLYLLPLLNLIYISFMWKEEIQPSQIPSGLAWLF